MDRSWKNGPGLLNHVTFEEARYGLFLAIAYVENHTTIDHSLAKTLKDVLRQVDSHNNERISAGLKGITVKREYYEETGPTGVQHAMTFAIPQHMTLRPSPNHMLPKAEIWLVLVVLIQLITEHSLIKW